MTSTSAEVLDVVLKNKQMYPIISQHMAVTVLYDVTIGNNGNL